MSEPFYPPAPGQPSNPPGHGTQQYQPGGWQPHPAQMHGARPMPPSQALAVGAVVVAGLVTVFEVLEAVGAWSAAQADVYTIYAVIAIPFFLALVAAYAVTCLWLWRARKFAEAYAPGAPHARRAGWIWAGWLVPVVSLWFPYQIVRDIHRATDSGSRLSGQDIGFWWAAYLTYNVISYLVMRLSSTATPDAAVLTESLSALAAIVAFLLWLRIVLKITRNQQTAAARQALG